MNGTETENESYTEQMKQRYTERRSDRYRETDMHTDTLTDRQNRQPKE